ncbi:hypothetical protein [Xanthomonas axonopodis]
MLLFDQEELDSFTIEEIATAASISRHSFFATFRLPSMPCSLEISSSASGGRIVEETSQAPSVSAGCRVPGAGPRVAYLAGRLSKVMPALKNKVGMTLTCDLMASIRSQDQAQAALTLEKQVPTRACRTNKNCFLAHPKLPVALPGRLRVFAFHVF